MYEIQYYAADQFCEILDGLWLSEDESFTQVAERQAFYQAKVANWYFGARGDFDKRVRKCDKTLQERIKEAIHTIEQNPLQLIGDTLEPLKHQKDKWRYRIGKYRLIYEVDELKKKVTFYDFDSRGGIYD
jgi:mRNA-degrading endonuclease RelE of RelBE toxin-antitoxin system